MMKIAPCDYPKEKVEKLKARFSETIEGISTTNTDAPIIFVGRENIFSFLGALKVEEGFEYNFLSDLTAYDFNPPGAKIPDYGLGYFRGEGDEPRFHVVYQLLSLQNKDRIRVKVKLRENEDIPTITPIWKVANWLEREVWDLYGIKFTNHPDLRRIMLDDRWEGHPLRKDYPIKKYQRFENNLDMAAVGLREE